MWALILCVLLGSLLGSGIEPVRAQERAAGGAQEFLGEVAGYPLHQNYTPEDYTPDGYGNKLASQNWAVTQDDRGIIYVANQSGVLTYDGARWDLIPTEQQTPVHTVVSDSGGTVYAGAYNELGRLAPDSLGRLRYVSLLDHVDPSMREFGHVWSGAVTDEAVYFQTRRVLFRWDGTKMESWTTRDATRFFKVVVVRDTVYVAQENDGLKRLVDGALEPVPGSDRIAEGSIITVLPYGDDELLVGTAASDLFVSRDGRFVPFDTEADPFLKTNELYDAVRLPNGTYAFATLWGGVVTVDAQGRTLRLLDEQTGLVDDDVKSLFVDRQDGLWMACEDGIARADVMQPLSVYDARAGLDGVGISLARYDGGLYVGTSSGIFRLNRRRASDGTVRPQFERIPGLRGQAFQLLATETGLLVATGRGVYVVRNDQARLVGTSQTTFSLHPSRQTPDRVYVGYLDGLGVLERTGARASRTGGWTVGPRLAGFDKGIFVMEESDDGALWAASAYSGLWRLPAPGRLDSTTVVQQVAAEGETPQHIFRMAYLPSDGGLRIVTRDGIARPAVRGDSVAFVPDAPLNAALDGLGRIANIDVAPDGDLWAFSAFDDIYWLRADSSGYRIETPFAPMPDFKVYTSLVGTSGRLWVVGEKGVVRHVPREYPRSTRTMATLVRSVSLPDRDTLLYGGAGAIQGQTTPAGASARGPRLDYSTNSIRFEFAAPGFGAEESVEYRYRLEGFDDGWSAWERETRKEYFNLPPGSYRFHVEARNPRMWTADPAQYAFVVLPPWYRTVWAYLFYGAVCIGLFVALVRWRSAHLQRRADDLERLVAQRTEEVKEKARQLRVYNSELQRTNEQLQEAVEEKSKLLGVAAHDLKNPLFGIRALSEVLLERAEVEGKIERKIDLIRQSADDTLRLINDLLASAASSGQATLDFELIDLAGLAEWVVHSFRPQAERKNQTLRCTVPEAACLVEGDKRKLREAMNNLISNAIKYSETGAPIDVKVEHSGEEIQFAVADRGPGLSTEDQQRLFAPFQRLTPEPTGDEGSSGLGLYIVKQIVELHEGDVWVDSTIDEGSTFTIVLPASSAPGGDGSGSGSGTTRTAPGGGDLDASRDPSRDATATSTTRVPDEEVA